jgi:hypothetical protein
MTRRHGHTASRLALAPLPPQNEVASGEAILDQISSGALDAYLTPIAEAIRARYDLLQTVSSAKALAQLTLGDHVRINHRAKPRYLHGVHGTIVRLDDQHATVCVYRPIGRFANGEIRCPPLVLDQIPLPDSSQETPSA